MEEPRLFIDKLKKLYTVRFQLYIVTEKQNYRNIEIFTMPGKGERNRYMGYILAGRV